MANDNINDKSISKDNESDCNPQNKNNNKKQCQNNKSPQENGLGLASLSYADFVILSSTLSFAIAEELNDQDLDLLLIFLGMVETDLALLRTQRGIRNALSQTGEEAIIGAEESTEVSDVIASNSVRRVKKKKCIKKVKRKKRKKEISKNENRVENNY